jgi:hypothetical protein
MEEDFFRKLGVIQLYMAKNTNYSKKNIENFYNLKIYEKDDLITLFIIDNFSELDYFKLNNHKSPIYIYIKNNNDLENITSRFIKEIFTDNILLNYRFISLHEISLNIKIHDRVKTILNDKNYITYHLFTKKNVKKIKKKIYNINFLFFSSKIIDLNFGGCINNEINIMENLLKYANICYNTVNINDCFINNILDVNLANNKILSKIKITDKKYFYDNYDGILKSKKKFDITFVRSSNSPHIEKLFFLLPEPKIFSHNYNEEIWKKNYIGFQTNISCILSKHQLLGYIEDDRTLNYSKNMIIPQKIFIRYQPLHNLNEKYEINKKNMINIDIKKELDCDFLIGVSGGINKFSNPNLLINIIDKLRNEYENLKKIKLIVLTNMININIAKKDWVHIKNYPKNTYLYVLKQIDVCVNTWSNKCVLYSGSNKNLDCVVANIPIIIPFSYSYREIFGCEYDFYYNSYDQNESQEQLYFLLKKIIMSDYDKIKLNDIYENIRKHHNNNVIYNYISQINQINNL